MCTAGDSNLSLVQKRLTSQFLLPGSFERGFTCALRVHKEGMCILTRILLSHQASYDKFCLIDFNFHFFHRHYSCIHLRVHSCCTVLIQTSGLTIYLALRELNWNSIKRIRIYWTEEILLLGHAVCWESTWIKDWTGVTWQSFNRRRYGTQSSLIARRYCLQVGCRDIAESNEYTDTNLA